MAAQELNQMLHNHKIELSEEAQQKIIKLFIHQLDDLMTEVKSQAVRCLGKDLVKIGEET